MNLDLKNDDLIGQAQTYFQQGNLIEAGKICQQLMQQNPRDDRAWALWGCIIDSTGDNAKAVKCFLNAIECNPNEATHYINAGQQFLRLSDPQKARPLFEKYLEMKPDSATGHKALGKTYTYLREYTKAEPCFRKSLELDPENLETYEQFAYNLERMNHIDEAEKILEEGLKKSPDHSEFLLPLSQLKRRAKQHDEALKMLDRFISIYQSKPSLTTPESLKLSTAYNEQGKILEKKKEFDSAFQAFLLGQGELAKVYEVTQKAKNSQENAAPEYFKDFINKSTKWFNSIVVEGWDNNIASTEIPPLFLVGFPRSGTTLMGNILAAHNSMMTLQEEGIIESILLDLPKLLNNNDITYPKGLDKIPSDTILALQKAYMKKARDLMEIENTNGKTLVDKMPLNNCYLAPIYRLFPKSKILSMLRDPRDVCLSCFVQNFNHNQATTHFTTLENTINTYKEVMNLYLQYREILPKEFILEVKYEDLVSDLEGNARKILEFAGQEWDENVLEYYRAENNLYVATPSYENVMKPVYKTAAGKWRSYEKYFEPHLHILEPFVKEFGYET